MKNLFAAVGECESVVAADLARPAGYEGGETVALNGRAAYIFNKTEPNVAPTAIIRTAAQGLRMPKAAVIVKAGEPAYTVVANPATGAELTATNVPGGKQIGYFVTPAGAVEAFARVSIDYRLD